MEPYTVQAEFSFKGSNNDELCFKKGDIITVTQREEGGWWEGTFTDKTGWFPSNYVKEYKTSLPVEETIRPPEEIQASRLLVLNELFESEKAHVAEIRGLLENFLEPLATSQILTNDEYSQLLCNFVEIVDFHEELLQNIEDCNDRVGKLFLAKAPTMKKIHQSYCAAHPRAIVILDKYKDELESFMERQGAASPGLLVLTTGLSKPFRRLDKYSAMLQELERHMESGHADRGDTQRSVAVFKDIASSCSATRRQKELELQVLTGPVRGWQGQELSTLGEIIHMGSVAVGPDHSDRYFVLFQQTLLILSVSQRMSAFIYEGKLPLSGIVVNRLDDNDNIKNAFEITGPLIERRIAVCQGPNEANKWVDLLTTQSNGGIDIRRQTGDLKRNVSSSAVNIPQPPPHMSPPTMGSHPQRGTLPSSQVSQHKRSLSFNHHLSYNQVHNQPPLSLRLNQPPPTQSRGVSQPGQSVKTLTKKANWNITNLRPAPPLRPTLNSSNSLNSGSSRRPAPTYEEDALVLRVIEAYCAAYQNNSRNTMNSALQPWTPCLPIRGGKLKSSKNVSTSNPQLPFICTSTNNSSSSLNSSYIWREASPNNFNMYSASVSSLNTSYRYSLSGGNKEWRAASEEKRTTRSGIPKYEYKTGSNYDNIYINSSTVNTPLLTTVKHKTKIWKSNQTQRKPSFQQLQQQDTEQQQQQLLYDRRLNRSFEAPQGYVKSIKNSQLRRSTPHLASDAMSSTPHPISRNSTTSSWCCGNFVLKQWRKVNNYEN